MIYFSPYKWDNRDKTVRCRKRQATLFPVPFRCTWPKHWTSGFNSFSEPPSSPFTAFSFNKNNKSLFSSKLERGGWKKRKAVFHSLTGSSVSPPITAPGSSNEFTHKHLRWKTAYKQESLKQPKTKSRSSKHSGWHTNSWMKLQRFRNTRRSIPQKNTQTERRYTRMHQKKSLQCLWWNKWFDLLFMQLMVLYLY